MLVYLKPQSIFPQLHSDTIFGSIVYSINQIYPEKLEKILETFHNQNPAFIVSSAFPYIYSADEKIRFFPKIIQKPSRVQSDNIKKLKKVNYISENIFLKLASGKWSEEDLVEKIDQLYIQDEFLMEEKPEIQFKRSNLITPKNSINRISNASESIFYTSGDNYLNMGLFFIIETKDDDYGKIIVSALDFLSDRGFGSDISTGKGHFTYEVEDYQLPDYEADYFTTLSRFIPTSNNLESLKNDSWYEIGSKRGRSSHGEIRKQIRFFQEGSVFPITKEKYYGKMIKSGTDSVEYGYAFPFPLKEVKP
ncbi:MAG: type III-A CRISPR-associated RAMP protein Csm4 [Methanomicrobiales archaeon]